MLGSRCIDVQEIETGMIEDPAVQGMSLAAYMQFCKTSFEYSTTYFSWCDRAFYTTEFGYGHRSGFCYKQ